MDTGVEADVDTEEEDDDDDDAGGLNVKGVGILVKPVTVPKPVLVPVTL